MKLTEIKGDLFLAHRGNAKLKVQTIIMIHPANDDTRGTKNIYN